MRQIAQSTTPVYRSASAKNTAARLTWTNLCWALLMCLSALLLIILTSAQGTAEQLLHWFLIPTLLCGCLIGVDAVAWIRGGLGIFDPIGIIGLFGFHFFFLAPILHVSWDIWLEPWFTPPPDWRPWLGAIAMINCLGLIIYHIARRLWPSPKQPAAAIPGQSATKVWQLNWQRFPWILSFSLALSLTLQLSVYQHFGGINGYIETALDYSRDNDAFQGLGIQFLISESFPVLGMIGYGAYAQKIPWLRKWWVVLTMLTLFFVLQIFFGGLRGSRSNTIWALFWAAGIIHFWIRSISRRQVAIGLILLCLFMYLYGFYKSGGIESLQRAMRGEPAIVKSVSHETDHGFQALLLGDLARTDVQALLLYRLTHPYNDYQYAWGGTYLAGSAILVPSAIMPNKPGQTKTRQGTEALFGKGSYIPGYWHSSKIYALAGEAMLNFGPLAAPLAFFPLGLLVGWVQRCAEQWRYPDTRLMLLPALVNFCFVVLVSDFDNDIFFLMKNAGFPSLVLFLSSQPQLIYPRHQDG